MSSPQLSTMSSGSQTTPSFPQAQQAQIIRANQRDLYHIASLKEQFEATLRSWLGTRWLSRWDKEVDLLVKLGYYGLTTARATQTLGEEYTDIWQHSALYDSVPPPLLIRGALVLLPTLPPYLLARLDEFFPSYGPPTALRRLLKRIPIVFETVAELNLAIFYIWGTYYDVVKRILGVKKIAGTPPNPHIRPPSYSLLGILLGVRILHKLITLYKKTAGSESSEDLKGKQRDYNMGQEAFLDDRPITMFLGPVDPEGEPAKPAEEDERTMLDVVSISEAGRAARNCTLCLEERTDSCATECGHLFCWSCIVGWGREKAECPLCRQSLNLTRLLPIYNL
ncbi:unnamed protein product [Mycena citricolor]|uniref:RING-type E3 ubiquitin transferase n=1 Tax=Mycena citricolor TaxID=2018698 RepID=A0AAD2GWP0_9AGAR|nr:unnamed protein product [Mycena citricolor]